MSKRTHLAKHIDHTLLKSDATSADIIQLCQEAQLHRFMAVCIMPQHVELAAQYLRDSEVRLATVVGFPLGAHCSVAKAFETEQAMRHGADEIDMVMSVGSLKEGQDEYVLRDIQAVVQAAEHGVVKVILETSLLTEVEIVRGCEIAMEAGAHFVKTSTGFGPGGAATDHVQLMRRVVGSGMGVKASGGIRTKEQAFVMLDAGANRLGTSAGIQLVT